MAIEDAIAAAEGLRDLLAQEIARAEAERRHVRELDSEGLFSWATARETFQAHVRSLQDEMAQALGRTAKRYGLPEVTLERLAEAEPRLAERFSERLAEVREQAARLSEADELNKEIVARALDCVRAYNSALNPRTVAYDRRGQAVSSAGNPTRHRSV